MPDLRSPTQALIWEMWARNRKWVWLVIGIVLFGGLLKWILPDTFSIEQHKPLGILGTTLAGTSLLLVLAIFNYTEFDLDTGSTGFPRRLFSLPVSSLRLVLVPIASGVIAIELYSLVTAILFGRRHPNLLDAARMGAFMVLYQTILWVFSRLGALRPIVLGSVAIWFIFISNAVSFLPSAWKGVSPETVWIVRLAALAAAAFVFAWVYVAHQRTGGRIRYNGVKALVAQIADGLPRRRKGFHSPSAAQFWFEWRRSGLYLPLCIAVLLLAVIGPLSWYMRAEPDSTLRILAATLLMPIILALPIGKGFSKPDFWSTDLSLPAFVAVRPLATDEIVVIKMKVAALGAAISWVLVLMFLFLWLPFRVDSKSLILVQRSIEMVSGQSVYALYAIVALSILAGVFVTWRFLVSGLWIGLSGNRKLFAASAVPYGLLPLGLIAVLLIVRPDSPLRIWIHNDPGQPLLLLEWTAVLVLIAKFSIAAFSWRKIARQHVRQYLLIWLGGTFCLIALAILLWSGVRHVFPLDVNRLRNVLILVALLVMPFARLGLAPSFLAKNRHR